MHVGVGAGEACGDRGGETIDQALNLLVSSHSLSLLSGEARSIKILVASYQPVGETGVSQGETNPRQCLPFGKHCCKPLAHNHLWLCATPRQAPFGPPYNYI